MALANGPTGDLVKAAGDSLGFERDLFMNAPDKVNPAATSQCSLALN